MSLAIAEETQLANHQLGERMSSVVPDESVAVTPQPSAVEAAVGGDSAEAGPSHAPARPPKRPAPETVTLSDSDLTDIGDSEKEEEMDMELRQALDESARMSGIIEKKRRAPRGGGRRKGRKKGKAKRNQLGFVDLTNDEPHASTSAVEPSLAHEGGGESFTFDDARDFVLAIVPDIELDALAKVLTKYQPDTGAFTMQVLQYVIDELLTKGYEKEGAKERERRAEEERAAKFDWLDLNTRQATRMDARYAEAALKALTDEFAGEYYHQSVKKIWRNSLLYAPAYFAIKKMIDSGDSTLKKRLTPTKRRAPGPSAEPSTSDNTEPQPKRPRIEGIELELDFDLDPNDFEFLRQLEEGANEPPDELKREITWVKRKIEHDAAEKVNAEEEKQREADAEAVLVALDEAAAEAGLSVECGCCYGEASPQTVAKCADGGHSFCRDCVRGYTNTRIGDRQYTLECMSTEGCQSHLLRFDVAQLVKPRSLELLDKIQQERELALAELDGWEVCPVCTEYGVCIENPDERLFRCERQGCLAVSCRWCKRDGHLGMSCKDAESQTKLPSLHAVEEAMSAALISRCPKCAMSYVKTEGCSFLSCPPCGITYCYICGKIGYQACKCPHYDDTAKRQFENVEAARREAAARFEQGEVDQAQLEKLALQEAKAFR